MVRRRREAREWAPDAWERVTVPPEPAEEEDEERSEPSERAAATLGNRGFAMLAREGAGVLPDGRAHPDVEAAIAASRGRGRPIDPGSRERFARALGDDLGDVRVHDDADAGVLARAVDARAFTVGRDVFFAEGERGPGTGEGDRLMAHELAHAVQGRGAPASGPLVVTQPGDPAEVEADRAAAGATAPRAAAGAPALRRAPKGKSVQTVTFGEDETEVIEGNVRTLDPASRGSAEQEIANLMGDLKTELTMTEKNLLTALDQFSDDQSFASSSEGEADFNGAFVSWATEQIVGKLVEQVGERLPYFGTIYELTFGLIEKLKAEDERAAAARGSRAIAEFLGKHRSSVTSAFDEKVRAVPAATSALVVEYQTLAAEHPDLATPTAPAGATPGAQPAVAGDAARFLTDLRELVARTKAPTFETSLQTIIEAWVAQSAGKLRSRGGGDMYVDGRINISMKMYKSGDSYTVTEKPKGKLQAPRAEHVVDSLKLILGKDAKSVNDLDILKVVKIRVEDEIEWGLNDWYDVEVRYRSKDRLEFIQTMGHPMREERVRERAPDVERKVLSMVTLEDLALTELTAAPEGR
jgi:hypothetical protein